VNTVKVSETLQNTQSIHNKLPYLVTCFSGFFSNNDIKIKIFIAAPIFKHRISRGQGMSEIRLIRILPRVILC
jgi:hypothetical protein